VLLTIWINLWCTREQVFFFFFFVDTHPYKLPVVPEDMGNHIATCCETDSNKNEMQKGRVREQEHAKRIAEMKAALGNGATGPLTTGMVEQSFQARKSQCVLSPRSIAT
jgi:hypothetical protein